MTARQVIEAAAATKLGGRFQPEKARQGQGRRGRRGRGNLEVLLLSSCPVGLLLALLGVG
jgi:hypothetical protein